MLLLDALDGGRRSEWLAALTIQASGRSCRCPRPDGDELDPGRWQLIATTTVCTVSDDGHFQVLLCLRLCLEALELRAAVAFDMPLAFSPSREDACYAALADRVEILAHAG